jgi:hypothetical protein
MKFIDSFAFLMDSAMIGVGVGFDTKGSELGLKVYQPKNDQVESVVIDDSREGWVDSLKLLLQSYLLPNSKRIKFDYS